MSRVADRLRIIGREVAMGNGRSLVAAIALALAVPSAARAQAAAPRSVEIGGGLGTVASWWTARINGGDVRVTVPVAARGDVEFLGAFGRSPDRSADIIGCYGGQFRLHFGERAAARVRPFMTFGAIGVITHSGRFGTNVSPPLLELAGAGVEQQVHRHLIVRAEAQSIVLLVVPAGVRVAAGVSIPIGSRR
jgi:hypothetical protein